MSDHRQTFRAESSMGHSVRLRAWLSRVGHYNHTISPNYRDAQMGSGKVQDGNAFFCWLPRTCRVLVSNSLHGNHCGCAERPCRLTITSPQSGLDGREKLAYCILNVKTKDGRFAPHPPLPHGLVQPRYIFASRPAFSSSTTQRLVLRIQLLATPPLVETCHIS